MFSLKIRKQINFTGSELGLMLLRWSAESDSPCAAGMRRVVLVSGIMMSDTPCAAGMRRVVLVSGIMLSLCKFQNSPLYGSGTGLDVM